jgi:hypothetical protein
MNSNTIMSLNNKYLTKCFINIIENNKDKFISLNTNITDDIIQFNNLYNEQQKYLLNKKISNNLEHQVIVNDENNEYIKKYNNNLFLLEKIKKENEELLNKYNDNIKLITTIQNENNMNISKLLNKKNE